MSEDAATPLPAQLGSGNPSVELLGLGMLFPTQTPASGERKAQQTGGERGDASEAAEQLPRPLSTHKEATAENAECNSQYVRKASVGFHGPVRLVSALNGCCL